MTPDHTATLTARNRRVTERRHLTSSPSPQVPHWDSDPANRRHCHMDMGYSINWSQAGGSGYP